MPSPQQANQPQPPLTPVLHSPSPVHIHHQNHGSSSFSPPQHLSPKHTPVSPPKPSSYHANISPVTVHQTPVATAPTTATHLLTTVSSPLVEYDKIFSHHHHHHQSTIPAPGVISGQYMELFMV